MSKSLPEWIDYIQTIHAREIDLSLDRVATVFARLFPEGLSSTVITIAGTNGKGSTAEVLNSIYGKAGYKVGKYSSPHLVRFNERIEIDGQTVGDEELLLAFDAVEEARDDVPLTFFEFGTLLAWLCFERAEIEICILEVGLGGRLDATNIVDADVAVLTNVSLDHTAWLGDTVELIAREKVGIARPKKPLIVGMYKAPDSVYEYANQIQAQVSQIGVEFDCEAAEGNWSWSAGEQDLFELPLPFSQSGVQLNNASCALMAIDCLQERHSVSLDHIHQGLQRSTLRGRCQIIQHEPLIILDVSHNEASLKRLSDFVSTCRQSGVFSGEVRAVCGMLRDKDINKSMNHIADQVSTWHLASINNDRGASAREVLDQLPKGIKADLFDKPLAAFESAKKVVNKCDCLLVFGSFHVAGDILAHLKS